MTPVTGGALWYVSCQKGIIQGHLVHRYASRRAPALCSRIIFSDCTFTKCRQPDCFPILHVRKYSLRGYFSCLLVSMLRTGCYVKQMKSIQFFNPSSAIYMWAQVNSSTIVNIRWLIQTLKYQCCGFQVYFKSILVYNLKTKSDFWSKCPHYIMGCIIKLGSIFSYFHWFWIWHISIIHCAKFEVYTCSICDVVTIPINACSSLFNRLRCC